MKFMRSKGKFVFIMLFLFSFCWLLFSSRSVKAATPVEAHGIAVKVKGGVVRKKGNYLCFVSKNGKVKKLETIKSLSTPNFCVQGNTVYYMKKNCLYTVQTNGSKKTKKKDMKKRSTIVGIWKNTVILQQSNGDIYRLDRTKKKRIMQAPAKATYRIQDVHMEGNSVYVYYNSVISAKQSVVYRYNLKKKKLTQVKNSTWDWTESIRKKTTNYVYRVEASDDAKLLVREDASGQKMLVDFCKADEKIYIAGANNGATVFYYIVQTEKDEKGISTEKFVLYRKTGTGQKVKLLSTEDCKNMKYARSFVTNVSQFQAYLYKQNVYLYLYDSLNDEGALFSVNKDGEGLKMLDGYTRGRYYSIWDVKQIGDTLYYAKAPSSEEEMKNYSSASYKALKLGQ